MVDSRPSSQKSIQKNIRMLVNMLVRVIKALVRELAYVLSFGFERLCAGFIAACRGEVILRSPGYHVFFGYYDVSPFCADGRRVLATRVSKDLSSPAPNRVMEVGYFYIDRPDKFISLGSTTAWCWQQGCRLQWYPANKPSRHIFYNTFLEGRYLGLIQNIDTGVVEKTTTVPLYDISKDGVWGLSLDFSRLQRLRPGYGYNAIVDVTNGDLVPAVGGVTLYEIASGTAGVVVSYKDLVEFSPVESMIDAEHYLNHLSFSPSGDAFVFFHFWVREGKRFSRLLWVDRKSLEIVLLNNSGRVSHYAWRNERCLLIYCAPSANMPMHYYEYDLEGLRAPVAIGKDVLVVDGHPTFFNCSEMLITDTYPNRWRRQILMVYDFSRRRVTWCRSYFRSRKFSGELRADLHPRLDHTQDFACVDDEVKGRRVMRVINLRGK